MADDLAERLISLFRRGEDGRRPAATTGGLARFEAHPDWQELPAFYEYFHGDTGGGLGAAHQTGWTALVADLILSRPVRRGCFGRDRRWQSLKGTAQDVREGLPT